MRRSSALLLVLAMPLTSCSMASGAGEPPPNNEGGSGGGNLGGAGGAAGGAGGGAGLNDEGTKDGPLGDNLVCPIESFHTLYLSPDDSGSMASPVWARELLRKGVLPDGARIRPWEFMNYYHFDLPEPPNGDRVELHAELVELDKGAKWELLLAIRARSMPRPPVGMTFVIDTSASMAGPGMARARRAVTSLIQALQPGDVVSVVRWASDVMPIVDGVTLDGVTQNAFAADVAESLAPFGGSDLTAGLEAGYALAKKNFVAGGHNRVVLVSDGGASPSPYDLANITKELGQADDQAIFLTGVGVGPAEGYNDELMDLVTDAGRGSYAYVDEPDRAPQILSERFDELMFVAEEVITVQLDLPGYLALVGSSAEAVSPNPNDIKDQHIAPGDTVVLRQELELFSSCGPEVLVSPAYAADVVASVSSGKGVQMTPLDSLSLPMAAAADKASAAGLKARAIDQVARALRDGDLIALQVAHGAVVAAAAALPSDPELMDLGETLSLFFSKQ